MQLPWPHSRNVYKCSPELVQEPSLWETHTHTAGGGGVVVVVEREQERMRMRENSGENHLFQPFLKLGFLSKQITFFMLREEKNEHLALFRVVKNWKQLKWPSAVMD